MTTGNTVASTVNVASVAVSATPLSDCKTLDKKNKEERDKVIEALEPDSPNKKQKLTKDDENTLNKARRAGMTITSAMSQLSNAQVIFSACSSGCAQMWNPSGLVEGGTSEQKMGLKKEIRASTSPKYNVAKKNAGVLCDGLFVHPGGGFGSHAEPKIINHMSNLENSGMKGGSILFSIDWKFSKENRVINSGMPCSTCLKMMCYAKKVCEIDIYICDKDGNPQQLSEDHCTSEDASKEERDQAYSKLCETIDGNSKRGR